MELKVTNIIHYSIITLSPRIQYMKLKDRIRQRHHAPPLERIQYMELKEKEDVEIES